MEAEEKNSRTAAHRVFTLFIVLVFMFFFKKWFYNLIMLAGGDKASL